jgi:sulfate/thiosulfate transport system substrate-binding protein
MSIDKGEKLKRVQVRIAVAGAFVVAVAVLAAACGGSSGSTAGAATGGKINLVAYSTPETSYAKLIPAFNKTAAGKGVTFTQSYGASGDQSRAVAAGQAADVVHFALEPDIQRLVDAKLVSPNWDQGQYKGFVANTMVVFVVRKGNPKHITTWDDLTKPGIQVITPNPFTSGGARWNVMAAYGSQLKEGKTPAQAQQYLTTLFHHVPVQDDKASAALQTFTGGKGDVLLAYEQDALLAQQSGAPIQIVYPPQTIEIQTPIATTVKASSAATSFVKWMYTPAAQTILAQTGYRPVVSSVESAFTTAFPNAQNPTQFTITDVDPGGWDNVMTKFFDPTKSIMQQIESSIGVSTSS